MNIEKIGNFKLPDDFKQILDRFEQKFNGEGFSQFASYIGIDWVTDIDEVRGYELVPFEAELPFPTGSNGEHMGWLNLCPNQREFKKPFICWAPLGGHIFYHGTEVKQILANSIFNLHSPKYEDIDTEFLKELGIHIETANKPILVNYEDEPLNKIPLSLPEGYQYEITSDGVGVIANSDHFSNEYTYEQSENSIEEYLELAKQNFDKSYFATSLFLLKEAYYKNYYSGINRNQIFELLKLKEITYKKLQLEEAAKQVDRMLIQMKPSR